MKTESVAPASRLNSHIGTSRLFLRHPPAAVKKHVRNFRSRHFDCCIPGLAVWFGFRAIGVALPDFSKDRPSAWN